MQRREVIKLMGLTSTVLGAEFLAPKVSAKPSKAVRAILIGAGDRGNTYSKYALEHPEELQMISVAEPRTDRRETYANRHGIETSKQFDTWEKVFLQKKFADCVVICTPDALHFAPAMKALEMGYHVLVEKPLSPSLEECLQLQTQAHKTGKILAVCHVLRYSPYFQKLKSVIDGNAIGQLIQIDHFEPVGYWHMAHSYVRGNWRNAAKSSFMLLAKSCHDLDIIRWLVGRKCTSIASFGDLTHFKPAQAPQGSTDRCTDGCLVERECPYSAIKIYVEKETTGWPVSVITTDFSKEGRMKALREGPYGRCVYHCDNDVVDHQTVSMKFENDVTVNFTMSGFTPQQGMGMRQTRIMGTKGYLQGDMQKFVLTTFNGNQQEEWDSSIGGGDAASGHGGGDLRLVKNFVEAVANNNPNLLTSTVDASIDSHVMAFKAEESRLSERIVRIY